MKEGRAMKIEMMVFWFLILWLVSVISYSPMIKQVRVKDCIYLVALVIFLVLYFTDKFDPV
jgi:hypothetical protein